MSTIAEVKLWGSVIGAIVLADGAQTASFQYDPDFVESGIEVSPIVMPLAKETYSFPNLSQRSFHGLPGLLADSLPDRYGNALIEEWLIRQGRAPNSLNAVERLCYTGSRGMGALEFIPAMGPEITGPQKLRVDQLVVLADKILAHRSNLKVKLTEADNAEAMKDILLIGTSAGGARAKAIIAWNPETNEVRSGQSTVEKGFEHWLIKFDGIGNNRDKELSDPQGYGVIEYAYHQMAKDCGITMSECRLFEEGGRRHFMTKRFDRLPDSGKLHMQSLAAMGHLDFNMAGVHSYEQAFGIMRQLGFSAKESTQLFRRMVFNIVARNQDDHVKNIAFLMDRQGNWSLAPAYDVAYSYQPDGDWTANHQMSLNGKRDGFTMDDFTACGKNTNLKRRQAKQIVEEIRFIVSRWAEYAESCGVFPDQRDRIHNALRLEPFP
jgi:serine/threonine-protein kinase HipA